MWLRKLVALAMIITLIGMNAMVFAGVFGKPKPTPGGNETTSISLTTTAPVAAPTVTISVDPATIPAGSSGKIQWSTTGSPTACTASGNWEGDKTQFGAESTHRVSNEGTYTYTLTCTNDGGSAKASASLKVGPAGTKPVASTAPSNGGGSAPTPVATYCGGRLPCYGPKEVATHNSKGNCWGWNGDRVINITGFDAAYHQAKSGIGSIEIGGVCGTDLAPSLNGAVSAGGQTENHKATTKSNSDRNEIPYFVGYYDASKK